MPRPCESSSNQKMEIALKKHLYLLLGHLRQLLSPITLTELILSLLLLLRGLSPLTISISGGATKIHLWAPRRRRLDRPALVLLHGFGGFAKWQFAGQIGPLSRCFDLYLPDLLFFGGSETSEGYRTVEFQAKCVAEAMRRLGVEKYSVAGISYGGFVAFRMAAEVAEKEVERVVIITSGITMTAAEMSEMREREERVMFRMMLPEKAEDLRILLRWCFHHPSLWMPEFILQDFVEIMFKNYRKERAELLKELLTYGVGWDPLPLLKQESLILWGDQDTIFPLPLAYALKRHLGGKARLQVIQKAGHALQMEKPHHVNNLIKRFILQEDVV